jgi:hypothetical protein
MRNCCAIAALLLSVAPVATAAGPTCALLDPEKTPRAALLEAKLLAEPGAAWVERADIDKVLKEQKLQAAFGPQGVGERVKLGKLLKADLLVMVRPVKDAKEPALEVVVSETATGLRLLLRAVPVTKNAGEDVAALLTAAKDGIKRHGEAVKEIVAVPPFVSNDLEFTHEHLKGAFAKLAEAEAFDRRGVLVVELEEAEALAKEIALAAPGSTLSRPQPVYLLGEFRHEGKGKEATVAVKLRAEHGGKLVGKPAALVVKPEESPAAVRKWSAGVLDALAKDDRPRPPADPKAEAKQLADRAKVFERLGSWSESLALVEASLLLDPTQTGLRVDALNVLAPFIRQRWNHLTLKATDVRTVTPHYIRGLQHLDALTAEEGLVVYRSRNGVDVAVRFLVSPAHLLTNSKYTTETNDLINELVRERREVLTRMIPRVAPYGGATISSFVSMAVYNLPPKARFEFVEPLILALPERAQSKYGTINYVEHARVRGLTASPPPPVEEEAAAYEAFLKRLAGVKNPHVQAGLAELNQRWAAELAQKKPGGGNPASVTDPNAPSVVLKTVELVVEPKAVAPKTLSGVLAVGPNLDVLWTETAIFLMQEKGKLRRVWMSTDVTALIRTVGFDGRYIWATVTRDRRWPLLVAIDTQTGKAWDVSDGLPRGTDEQLKIQGSRTILASPLDTGRACVVGSFGRAWVAVATLDPANGKAAVKVIHEARDAQDETNKEQANQTTVDFQPLFASTIRGAARGGKAELRVIVGRGGPLVGYGSGNSGVASRPLVIDPDRPAVEVLRGDPLVNRGGTVDTSRLAPTPDAVFLLEYDPLKPATTGRVSRIGWPDLTKTLVAEGFPRGLGKVAVHQGKELAVLDATLPVLKAPAGGTRVTPNPQEWWMSERNGKAVRLTATDLPPVRAIAVSSHYGLVALVQSTKPQPTITLHTVEFAPPRK